EVSRTSSDNPRAWYNLGLLYKTTGETDAAIEAFAHAAKLAPEDSDTQYFLGLLLTQGSKLDEAIAAFELSLKLNPTHASAEFGVARAWQRKGDAGKSQQHLQRFQHLVQERISSLLSPAYGEQGALSLAEEMRIPPEALPPPIPVTFVRDTTSMDTVKRVASKFPIVAGDYDNDGREDRATAGPEGIRLFHNDGNWIFRDVTKSAGVDGNIRVSSLKFVDIDHDGDLDLIGLPLLDEKYNSILVWRNNGNGTFTDITDQLGLHVAHSSKQILIGDFNNDRAVDLLVLSDQDPPILFLNQRDGSFKQTAPWKDSTSRDFVWGTVLDFDHDGWMDVAVSNGESVTIWRNAKDGSFEKLVSFSEEGFSPRRFVALDFDNDGWRDIAVLGSVKNSFVIRVLRNEGGRKLNNVTDIVGLSQISFPAARQNATYDITAIDYDNDGDTDLTITGGDDDFTFLRNDGGNKNHSLRLSLKGLADNKSAIGTKVEIFAGALYQKFEITSPNPLLVGLGQETQADIVRMLWPTGVLQDEVNLSAATTHKIREIDRRGSSCPLLFVWNGTRYEFVSDMIGAGIVGHWVAPGQYNVPDPTEYLRVPSEMVQLKNGRVSFRFMEAMEEVVYLDQARLLAVDHPSNVEVFPNEYFASAPPFPEFKVITSKGARAPVAAVDDRGRDVLPSLLHRDGRYVTGFADEPYRGFAKMHSLELDLGAPVSAKDDPLRLLLYGFIDYATPTTSYAAKQGGVNTVVPYVEALDASGHWVRVTDDMGFPAGLSRWMVADLTGRIPIGSHRIRISTNLKIYWDQILVDRTPGGQPFTVHEVPLAQGDLRFIGYPREQRGALPSDLRYDYQNVSAIGPYARHAGNYTRYGDVRALLQSVDDRFAILASGDEVALDFDPGSLPPLTPGWKRDYFFFAHGYCKDMDFYAAEGNAVPPVPFAAMDAYPFPPERVPQANLPALNYSIETNSRLLSEKARAYRFAYPHKKIDKK
ncbi:MAG: VCBS repeat-containing protein, partial [Acidobacteria bacterium]|nr:VCBS repeat-containing protein [Acidobacteriota bacterium]